MRLIGIRGIEGDVRGGYMLRFINVFEIVIASIESDGILRGIRGI